MKTIKFLMAACVFCLVAIMPSTTKGQAINTPSYRTALGIRAGYTTGLTFKYFFTPANAMEAIVGVWPNSVGLTLMYERHAASPGVSGFFWYYGAGAHVATNTERIYYINREDGRYYYRYRPDGAAVGIDGIVGIEYKIKPIPIALSFDLKPFVEMNTRSELFYMYLDPSLGLKFTF